MYRYVDTSELVKTNGKYIWKNNIGKHVRFIYDDISGDILIKDYNSKDILLTIVYENIEYYIAPSGLLDCTLGKMLGKTDRKYKWNIGDIIEYEDERFEVIDIKKYESGRTNYILKCLKCGNIRSTDEKSIISGIKYKTRCKKCSKNKFELSEDGTYWIGYTQNGDVFYFNGDSDTVNYIKSNTWRKLPQGYFQNNKGEKLHRVVLGITDKNIFVNHIGGNKYDNRKEKLSLSNCLDNSKEKKISSRNQTGIIGLMKRRDKYVGNIKINDISLYSKYKEKDEALIDLLIMQKHYGFRHNENLYYMIDNIDKKRIKEVIDNCERQLNKKRNDEIISKNKYELSEDGNYYWIYDDDLNKEINRFKISKEDLDKVLLGKWHIAYDKSNDSKLYVHGSIIVDGKRKTVKLHRYLMDLLDVKYKNYFIDHKNGDGLDNRKENLCITTPLGNGHKKNHKGYKIRNNINEKTYRVVRKIYGVKYDKTFKTIEEAEEYIKYLDNLIKENKPLWENKKELDEYLKNNIDK